MTDFMLQIYCRNQLYLNPRYEGELLVVKGETVDTTETAMKVREGFSIDVSKPVLEMYMAYLCNEDSVSIQSLGKEVALSHFLRQFYITLPVKRHAERVLEKLFPVVVDSIIKNIAVGKSEIVGNSLFVSEVKKSWVEIALRHLFGLEETRFIFNMTKTIPNGNLLDVGQETLSRFTSIKSSCSSYANLIKAIGFPYSNYRRYISLGILVSIDLNENVYVIENDSIFCMSLEEFEEKISSGTECNASRYVKEYDLSNLKVGTYIRLNKKSIEEEIGVLLNERDC